MKCWVLLPVILLFAIVQAVYGDFFSVFHARPDFLLSCAVLASLACPRRFAFALSVLCGVLKDCCGIHSFGVNTVLFALWSYAVLSVSKKITVQEPIIAALLMASVTLAHGTVLYLLFLASGKSIAFFLFLRIVLLETVLNSACFPVLLRMVKARVPLPEL
jgi:rod shape-determining protein MreD